jgi:hypothetical protein
MLLPATLSDWLIAFTGVLTMFANMSRRSTPQKKIDEAAFPVKVRLAVPGAGLGKSMTTMYAWLTENVPKGDWAFHSDGQTVLRREHCDVAAVYFRDTGKADAFMRALELELADGTTDVTYTSPAFPFGRPV